MRKKNTGKILLSVFIFGIFMSTSLSGQSDYLKKLNDSKKNPDGTYTSKTLDQSQRPEDSYLAKFHAIDVVRKLMRDNLERIYLLKVIVTNYKDKGWDAEYKKCYEGYRLAMELYYRRNVIYSRREFENNRKMIKDLLKKVSIDYKNDTEKMLNECAAKILELHLDEKTRSDPNKTEELFKNQSRLKISYGQFDDGESSFIDHNYVSSILHYRVAKTYAIKILEDLAKPEEKDKIQNRFRLHKADNLNRIFEGGKSSRKGSSSTGKKTGP